MWNVDIATRSMCMKSSKTKPDLRLRLARLQDCAALARLWHAGWHLGHNGIVPETLVKYRDENSFAARIAAALSTFYVAEIDGDLAGFVRLKDSELDQFYVAEDHIGRGVASALMDAAERMLVHNGTTHAHLIAATENHRAIRFYEKHGWKNTGTIMAPVDTFDGPFEMNVVRMTKSLIS